MIQQSIDNVEDPPLFGICHNEPSTIYRITTIATAIYTNSSLSFYDGRYPVDVGRVHFMVILPGRCSETLPNAHYDHVHAVYVNLETLEVDFCHEDIPRAYYSPDAVACGNGILDYQEACDDGNNRNGDGCNSVCGIEPGWRCYNVPYQTKCKK